MRRVQYILFLGERRNSQKIFVRRRKWRGQLERHIFWWCGLDSTGLGLVPVLKCHECFNEWSDSIKHVKFSDWLCKCCLIREMFAPRIIKKIDEGRCISTMFKSYGMLNAYKGYYLSILQVHSLVSCICATPDELCSWNWTKNSALLGDVLQHTVPTAQAGHGCPSWFWIQCNGELGADNFPVIVYRAVVDIYVLNVGPARDLLTSDVFSSSIVLSESVCFLPCCLQFLFTIYPISLCYIIWAVHTFIK